MSINPLAHSIRAKKLGVLIYDARLASRRSVQDCAQAIGVPIEKFQDFESGSQSPSLPEIEVLAYYLNISLDHFWSRISVSENLTDHQVAHVDRLIQLRQKMIGASLRQTRSQANLSAKEVADKAGITETELQALELGLQPVPLPILESLVAALGSQIDYFKDQRGPVASWMNQQRSTQRFLELSVEMQEFVSKPVNHPYVDLAMRLSELSVEKLRAVAESLLEITY
jgi:transcriptional regulator with XRE-family HTH domain